MNSEKVKEIKKALECCKQNQINETCEYCDDCPASYTDWSFEEGILECDIDLLQKSLTLINELESENERLKHLREVDNTTMTTLRKSNTELNECMDEMQDRIAELESENKDYYDRLNNAQTYIDNHEEIWKGNTKIQLKQFAEMLKEKMGIREYMGVKYKQGVFSENDIDETLKEFDL